MRPIIIARFFWSANLCCRQIPCSQARLWHPQDDALAGEALGDSFAAHLAAFTENHPAPPPEGPRADAIAFARWLRDQESLPDSCLLELEIAAVSWRRPMKIVRLPESKKSALIIKFPVFGVRVFTLLPGWQAKATRS